MDEGSNKSRPFVFINSAITADGKLDTVARKGASISSPEDLARVDRLRSESDAIMVGGNTLLAEDPRLTVKSQLLRAERLARGTTENPIKVGVVSRLPNPEAGPSLRDDSRFLTSGPPRVVIFTSAQTEEAQIAHLRELGVEVHMAGKHRVDLVEALWRLRELGVKRLMVEGGGTLNAELLRLGLVDEIHLYIAPLIFGGANAPTLVDGMGLQRDEAIRLELRSVDRLADGGIIVRYAIKR